MKTTNIPHVICVLDASGSMSSYEEDVRDGMNALLEDQKTERGNMGVSIVVYSSRDRIHTIKKEANIQSVGRITSNEYSCTGLTAMYDGIKTAINIDPTACIIIQTDGSENNSITSASEIKKLIENAEQQGAEFHLFGAGHNVDNVSGLIGIKNHITLPRTKKAMETSYSMMSDIASEYRFKKDNVKLV